MSVYNESLFNRKFLTIILIYRYITLLTKHTYNGVFIRQSLNLVILNSLLIISINGLQLIAVHVVPYKQTQPSYKFGQITGNHDLFDINMR